jgi:hypothetical protein
MADDRQLLPQYPVYASHPLLLRSYDSWLGGTGKVDLLAWGLLLSWRARALYTAVILRTGVIDPKKKVVPTRFG